MNPDDQQAPDHFGETPAPNPAEANPGVGIRTSEEWVGPSIRALSEAEAAEMAMNPPGRAEPPDHKPNWKNLALLAMAKLSASSSPELFEMLHELVADDNRRAAVWVVKPAGEGEWMYEAKNTQNGKTLLTSETEKNRADVIDMAHWFAGARGAMVVDQHGIEL